jgi:uroporphyrinogen-III decarboxylase
MLDMYRQPDKLLAAIDKMTQIAINLGVSSGKGAKNPMVWMFLHKGAGGFMSDEQFNTFYWPSLRKLIVSLIDEGLTPVVYSEGDYTPRLESIADMPKGKVIWHYETVDMHKAKEILGDVACFMGNVPLTILNAGTPADVEAYCKKLIEVVGKDGGLIMDTSAALDEARPENVKAMVEATRKYGNYQ